MSANTNADVAAMVAELTETHIAQGPNGGAFHERLINPSGRKAADLLQSQQAEITRLSAMVEEKDAALKRIASGKYMLATTVADIARQAISTEQG